MVDRLIVQERPNEGDVRVRVKVRVSESESTSKGE